jgi:hypothetical protein
MSTAVVPFNFAAPAVALAKKRENSANTMFLSANAPAFPELSIKGKVFTLVKGDVRKVLTRRLTGEDGTVEEVAIAAIPLAVLAGNPKARVFYDKGYTEGADNQKPTCFTYDGVAPDAQAEAPQSKKCQLCPHARWGSKVAGRNDGTEAKGTACAPRIRMAVTDPNTPAAPFMLNVPPGSAASWRGAVAMAENHGKDFFEVAYRVKFDMEAPTPKLVFEPYGMLTDEALEKIRALQNEPVVQDILGVATPLPDDAPVAAPAAAAPTPAPAAEPPAPAPAPKPQPKPPVEDDMGLGSMLGGALGGEPEAPVKPVAARAKPQPKPEKPAAKPEAAKPAAEPVGVTDDLLGGLQSLLGTTDD